MPELVGRRCVVRCAVVVPHVPGSRHDARDGSGISNYDPQLCKRELGLMGDQVYVGEWPEQCQEL